MCLKKLGRLSLADLRHKKNNPAQFFNPAKKSNFS